MFKASDYFILVAVMISFTVSVASPRYSRHLTAS